MRAIFLLLCLILAISPNLYADDGAASIAAGGIILMKREPRIAMAKEILQISEAKVTVDYDFRNDSGDDITTEVAFPVPAYTYEDDVDAYLGARFDDFKLTIDGLTPKFAVETRAFADKKDITAVLLRHHIDAATFGHMPRNHDYDGPFPDIERASAATRAELVTLGAIKDGDPNWRVEKKYHWTQTFPAHATVHIRHEYTPVLGNSNTTGDPAKYKGKDAVSEYASVCPDANLRTTLAKPWSRRKEFDSPISIRYVDFILTTANTWERPIEDFTLIVERPHIKFTKPYPTELTTYVSFCWDGAVTKIDADHFSAHTTNLIPTKELRIGFIDVDPARMSK